MIIFILKIGFLIASFWAVIWLLQKGVFLWRSIGVVTISTQEFKKSDHFDGDVFFNLEPTPLMMPETDYWALTKAYFSGNTELKPLKPLEKKAVDIQKWTADTSSISLLWMGHSAYAINAYGYIFLVDPVLKGYAAPLPFMNTAFEGADIIQPSQFSRIDAIIYTHDHYDHLDYESCIELSPKTNAFYCPSGVDQHLKYWGVEPSKVTTLDWWEKTQLQKDMQLKSLPARHFSGRLFKRNQTLWNAYLLDIRGFKIVLGGDSGYGNHFKQIRETIGAVDLALLECGQYHPYWKYIHMLPQEVPLAAQDLGAKRLIPVHWGKFALALHAWQEPIVELKKHMQAHSNIELSVPVLGEVMVLK